MNRNHQSKNKGERSYQGWISHTDEDMIDNSNYRSDGPGPVEIEAHDKYTHDGKNSKECTKSDDKIKEEFMKINKGSAQKSIRTKMSHEKKLAKSGVKNVGIQNSNQADKRQDLNIDEDDFRIKNKKEYNN